MSGKKISILRNCAWSQHLNQVGVKGQNIESIKQNGSTNLQVHLFWPYAGVNHPIIALTTNQEV